MTPIAPLIEEFLDETLARQRGGAHDAAAAASFNPKSTLKDQRTERPCSWALSDANPLFRLI